MAEERSFWGEEIRVDRVFERSRVEETVLASTYELLVPVQRWGWVLDRQRTNRSGSGNSSCEAPFQIEEESWRGFGS